MKTKLLLGIVVALCISSLQSTWAVSPSLTEIAFSKLWAATYWGTVRESKDLQPFFSFAYDDKPSAELLKTWKWEKASRKLDDNRTEYTRTYTDPKTGLVVRCVGIEYNDFPTLEWTLYFKNTSDKDTPILADIQALDISIDRPAGPSTPQTEFRLYHQKGAPATMTDYQPFETLLTPKMQMQLGSVGGRPCDKDFPYFNVQQGAGQGMIVVVGWPGQWAAKLSRDKENHLRITAGQELTHFKLLPGEEVRTPLIVLQFWKGDRIDSQNVWRRWMLAHNVPRPGGKLPPVELAACSSHYFEEMFKTNTEIQKLFVDRYLEEKIKLDYWWMDAGWYPCDPVGWWKTGTWEVDTRRFPKGLREVDDYIEPKGVKTIVWFEPERVHAGTWLAENHPEWILGGKNGGLLNLGNPDAWKWLTEHVNKMIDDQGIDLYRQDFNMAPLGAWRGADAADRQGITEIKHVTGYLAYWDDLIRHHPNMLIDSCASGGHRNDLETLRRSVPLLRSDYILEPVGNQGHTYGMAFWVPFFGTGGNQADPYVLRSVMMPGSNICFDARRKDLNYDVIRREIGLWRQYAPNFFGDYYPLTSYSVDQSAWISWQFDRPESGEGMIQAFRRAESPYESIRVKLHGLEPEATYTLTNVDVAGTTEASGRELMSEGIHIILEKQPAAAVILYKKKS